MNVSYDSDFLKANPALKYLVISTTDALSSETFANVLKGNRVKLCELCQVFALLLLDSSVTTDEKIRIRARLLMCLERLLAGLPAMTGTQTLSLIAESDSYVDFTHNLLLSELEMQKGIIPPYNLKAAYELFRDKIDYESKFQGDWKKLKQAAE